MLPIVVSVVWIIFIIIYNIINSFSGNKHNNFDMEDIIISTLVTFVGAGLITLMGSVIVADTGELSITSDVRYELTEVATGVYGYKDSYLYLYYKDDNGDLKDIRLNYDSVDDDIIYTDKSSPYYSNVQKDLGNEVMRYLFWNFCSKDINICVPPGSIIDKPD